MFFHPEVWVNGMVSSPLSISDTVSAAHTTGAGSAAHTTGAGSAAHTAGAGSAAHTTGAGTTVPGLWVHSLGRQSCRHGTCQQVDHTVLEVSWVVEPRLVHHVAGDGTCAMAET